MKIAFTEEEATKLFKKFLVELDLAKEADTITLKTNTYEKDSFIEVTRKVEVSDAKSDTTTA